MVSPKWNLHLSRCLLLGAILLLATFPAASAQQNEIECLVPQKMGSGERPVYQTGEDKQFQWKSTWPTFNLSIVQVDHITQSRTRRQIYTNEPNTTSNFIWTAENFGALTQDDPLHLWITNADDFACPTCACRSQNFTVLNAATTDTDDPTPTDTATPSSSPSSGEPKPKSTHLALGVGLGLGIPLLILLTALATWLLLRRRRRQQRQREAKNALATHGAFDEGKSSSSQHPPTAAGMPLPRYSENIHTGGGGGSPWEDRTEKSHSPAGTTELSAEVDGTGVAEMQTDASVARVEAPEDAFRVELEGDAGGVGGGR